MIFNLKKVTKLIKKKLEILFVFFLTIITITSTTSYNNSKKQIDENYKDFPCKCRSLNCCGYIVREGSRWRINKHKPKLKRSLKHKK